MSMESDILVIGGGLAGLVAGIKASQDGASVTLIRKGNGATSDSSGAIDIIGYLPGATVPFDSPLEGLDAVTKLMPFHPYSVLGRNGAEASPSIEFLVKRMQQATDWLSLILKNTPAQIVGNIETKLSLLTVLGTKKPTCLVQDTMRSDSSIISEESMILFAGIEGLQDYNARATALTFLGLQTSKETNSQKIAHTELSIAPFGKPYNIASMDAARYFDTDEGYDKLLKTLPSEVNKVGATHVAFPPILGVEKNRQVRNELEKETGAEIFELLSFPPSVPGYRLSHALEMAFKNSGGKLLLGHEAVDFKKAGEVSSITAKGPRRSIDLRAKSFVLASGKYLSGGIIGTEYGLREPLFGLPVVDSERKLVGEEKPKHLSNRISITREGHPVFSSGIPFDHNLRPLDSMGNIFSHNLFCAGAVLAGHNYPVEKSGLGVALLSGYIAGSIATKFAEEEET